MKKSATKNVLREYYRYDNHKLRTGGSHPLLGSLELGHATVYVKKNPKNMPHTDGVTFFRKETAAWT